MWVKIRKMCLISRSLEIVPNYFNFSHFLSYTLIAGYTNILKITHTVQLVIGCLEQYLFVYAE